MVFTHNFGGFLPVWVSAAAPGAFPHREGAQVLSAVTQSHSERDKEVLELSQARSDLPSGQAWLFPVPKESQTREARIICVSMPAPGCDVITSPHGNFTRFKIV